MNLKNLRDYLNMLNLNEVQGHVEIVYNFEGKTVCEDLSHFQLTFPDNDSFKPYLSLYAESFFEDLEKND